MSGRTHECPAPGCNRRVRNDLFACRRDWFRLPRDLRDAIWAGHEIAAYDPRPHAEAAQDAIYWWLAADEANKVARHPAPTMQERDGREQR